MGFEFNTYEDYLSSRLQKTYLELTADQAARHADICAVIRKDPLTVSFRLLLEPHIAFDMTLTEDEGCVSAGVYDLTTKQPRHLTKDYDTKIHNWLDSLQEQNILTDSLTIAYNEFVSGYKDGV